VERVDVTSALEYWRVDEYSELCHGPSTPELWASGMVRGAGDEKEKVSGCAHFVPVAGSLQRTLAHLRIWFGLFFGSGHVQA